MFGNRNSGVAGKGCFFRPRVELLEDRLVPAFSLFGAVKGTVVHAMTAIVKPVTTIPEKIVAGAFDAVNALASGIARVGSDAYFATVGSQANPGKAAAAIADLRTIPTTPKAIAVAAINAIRKEGDPAKMVGYGVVLVVAAVGFQELDIGSITSVAANFGKVVEVITVFNSVSRSL